LRWRDSRRRWVGFWQDGLSAPPVACGQPSWNCSIRSISSKHPRRDRPSRTSGRPSPRLRSCSDSYSLVRRNVALPAPTKVSIAPDRPVDASAPGRNPVALQETARGVRPGPGVLRRHGRIVRVPNRREDPSEMWELRALLRGSPDEGRRSPGGSFVHPLRCGPPPTERAPEGREEMAGGQPLEGLEPPTC
jgi:hypothetical protein